MVYMLVEYTLREGTQDAAEKAIKRFVEQIKAHEPGTLFYDNLRRGDSLEYLDMMCFRNREAQEQHRQAAYCQEFIDQVVPLCQTGPQFTELKLVASKTAPSV